MAEMENYRIINVTSLSHLVKHFVSTKYEDLPAPAVEAVKKEVLDSLATALGGSGKEGVKELVDLVREWGGNPQSTIIAYGIKCPAPSAAQVNGTMIHALDYDDGHQKALVHVGCVAVATAFAAAERMGKVSGKEFITAIALGGDFMARLALASHPKSNLLESGWHPTTLFGHLGAAVIAGRIFALDEDRLTDAIGLAYHQCGGAGTGVTDGALAKRMGPGFAARAGVTAALMAERGITGQKDALEGKNGLYHTYMRDDYDASLLTAGLGRQFENVNITEKPYPCCGLTHACIDAALALKTRYNIDTEQVSEIIAYGGQAVYEHCQPKETKCQPRTVVDAQFSVPWVVATALVKGKVTLEDFTEEAIKKQKIIKLASKVTGKLVRGMDRHGVGPAGLVIRMNDGKEYREEVQHCLGSPERPMSLADISEKFRECSKLSVRPIPPTTLERVIEMISNLEALDDATKVIGLL